MKVSLNEVGNLLIYSVGTALVLTLGFVTLL